MIKNIAFNTKQIDDSPLILEFIIDFKKCTHAKCANLPKQNFFGNPQNSQSTATNKPKA